MTAMGEPHSEEGAWREDLRAECTDFVKRKCVAFLGVHTDSVEEGCLRQEIYSRIIIGRLPNTKHRE